MMEGIVELFGVENLKAIGSFLAVAIVAVVGALTMGCNQDGPGGY